MRNLVAILCLGSGFCLADNPKPPTLAEARSFLDRAQSKLLEISVQDQRAGWVKSTFITYDTEILTAKADEEQIAATMQLAKESTRFNALKMPEDMARQFRLLRLSLRSQRSPVTDASCRPHGRDLRQRLVLPSRRFRRR